LSEELKIFKKKQVDEEQKTKRYKKYRDMAGLKLDLYFDEEVLKLHKD